MIKTHSESKIIQFHHGSNLAGNLLDRNSTDIVLQVEPINHTKYDFIAEIVDKKSYVETNSLTAALQEARANNDQLAEKLQHQRHYNQCQHKENELLKQDIDRQQGREKTLRQALEYYRDNCPSDGGHVAREALGQEVNP